MLIGEFCSAKNQKNQSAKMGIEWIALD